MASSDKNQGHCARFRGPQQVADLIAGILDPLLQKRAGMTMQLIMAWEDIVGVDHAQHTRPEKLEWPRQLSDQEPFEPACLKIACDSGRAIYVQHEIGAIVERVNTFFGFCAVDRIKIVQKPVHRPPQRKKSGTAPLDSGAKKRLSAMLLNVEDEDLRKSLQKLGEGVLSSHP